MFGFLAALIDISLWKERIDQWREWWRDLRNLQRHSDVRLQVMTEVETQRARDAERRDAGTA